MDQTPADSVSLKLRPLLGLSVYSAFVFPNFRELACFRVQFLLVILTLLLMLDET